jgi:transposase
LRLDLEEVFAELTHFFTTHKKEIIMPKARKRYVGLDVHKDVVEYCIIDTEGKKLDGGRFICEQSVLVNFAKNTLSPRDHVALESTTNTWAIVDILEPFVEKIVVGNPLKTKHIAEASVKTDKIDAMVLAQLLRCDYLPSVWIPDKKTRELRRISSFRKSLAQEATATKNRIRSVLNHLLVKHAVSWTKQGLDELKSLDLPSVERTIMDTEIAILEHQELQIEKIETEIQKLAYAEENIRILMTLPGIGCSTATAVLAVFGDITRFKDADHAASYLGLVPKVKKSADSCHYGSITKTGSALARAMLCEAAQHLYNNDGPLGVFIRRVGAKNGWNKGIVAGARKLATIAYHMLKNKEPYRYAAVNSTRSKLRILRTKAGGTKLPRQRYAYDEESRKNRPEGDFNVRYVPPLADVYKSEGLPEALTFDELSNGEQRVLKEMGVAEKVRANEKVGIVARPKKATTPPKQSEE